MTILRRHPAANTLIANHFRARYPAREKNNHSTDSKQTANIITAQQGERMAGNLQTDRFHFLHIDLNSFFASVEQQLHPEYRNRPLAVIPAQADTTCCSTEAKKLLR